MRWVADPGVSGPSTWISSFEKRILAERPAFPVWFAELVLAAEEAFVLVEEEVLEGWRALWSHPVMKSARSRIVKGRAVLIDMGIEGYLAERVRQMKSAPRKGMSTNPSGGVS